MAEPAPDAPSRAELAAQAWAEVCDLLDLQLSPLGMRAIDALSPIVGAIEKGGYRVLRTSGKLKKETGGITIYHSKSAEVIAREVSQRIMTLTRTVPAIEESKFMNSDADIVIWVGK